MQKLFLLAVIFLFSFSNSFSQRTVRGKITDNNGEALIGVNVFLKSNHSIGTTTDLDGNYSLKIADSNANILVISYISFQTIEVPVHPQKGEVVIKNFSMSSSTQEIKAAEVTAKAVKAKDYYLESIKKKSATSIDYVSSETMKKTGDNNVTAAVARVSGVSTNSGGFITVRGLGDRYVKTSINGSRIPTLDPFTNNIKLDIFPASLVDNVMITKTASPDLPGDWAGAYISVETKDYPENLAINIESTFGYNTQSTFKDVITSQRSSTDWLGYDNGLRNHDHSQFATANISPNQYQELVALGLGDYYQSMGITASTPWNETYFNLGLMQLGLLPPALLNDPVAIANAKSLYMNGPYSSQAFNMINADVPATGKSFASNWNTTTRKAPINFSQTLSIGNQIKLFGKPLGFLAGFRYYSSILYDLNATENRVRYDGSLESSVNKQSSVETNGWSGLINLAYKLNPNNSIAFMFMPNINGTNQVRHSIDDGDPTQNVVTLSQFYEQRKQLIYQLKTEHYIPSSKIRIELNASYTDGNSSAPDFKNLQYWLIPSPTDTTYQIGGTIGDGIHRYYRSLSDDLFDSRLSFEFPLGNKPGLSRKLKFGGAYQANDKNSNQYQYDVGIGPKAATFNGNVDQYFSLENFDIHSGIDNNGYTYSAIDAYYNQDISAANNTFGTSKIVAGFVMTDYAINTRVRIAGGLRIEKADIFTDVVKFDSLGLAENDPRRSYSSSYPLANPGKLNEVNFLPSVNLIYNLRNDDEAPFNVRLNYSQAVARPSIRELSDVAVFDYEYRVFVFGNSDLKTVRIDNYDVRLEYYTKSNDNISASYFYKQFKNHIELVNSGGYTWQNVDKSYVHGIELEGKKAITKNLSLSANVTLAKSNTKYIRTRIDIADGVKQHIPVDTLSRAMYGQAPYVINTILSYNIDTIGLTLALSYNVQGPRLVIVADVKERPDVYELPRNLLDFKITKTLGKHFSSGLTVKNILNAPIRRSYDIDDGWTLDYDKYTYGTVFELSIAYKL